MPSSFVVDSQQAVADFFGVARPTAKDWFSNGAPRTKKGRRYQYDLQAITRWRIEQLQNRGNAGEWRGVSEEYQAKMKQLEFERRSGQLMETGQIVSDLRELYVETRTQLLAGRSEFPSEYQDLYEDTVRAALASIVADMKERLGEEDEKNIH